VPRGNAPRQAIEGMEIISVGRLHEAFTAAFDLSR
jgi:hypothetical protein